MQISSEPEPSFVETLNLVRLAIGCCSWALHFKRKKEKENQSTKKEEEKAEIKTLVVGSCLVLFSFI